VAEKGRSTQSLANTFPPWSNVRADEQSLGFQLLNAAGKHMDDLHKQRSHIEDNLYLTTSIISDIDVYYRYKLPGTWDFSKEDDDDTEFTFTPPVVSGYYDTTAVRVEVADDNDIESFWYNLQPNRLSLNTTASGEHVLASGHFGEVRFKLPADTSDISGVLYAPNQLTITVDNGTDFVGLDDHNNVRRMLIQVEGETREGAAVTEEIAFVHNETIQTDHDFRSISDYGLRAFGANEPVSTSIIFKSANFNAEDYQINYELDSTIYDDDMPLFWALGSGVTSSTPTLDLNKYDIDDLELRMEGFTTKHSILQQELQSTVGDSITPLDLAVEPHSDRIWVVTSGMLYVYNARMPYPDTSQLSDKDYSAASVIEPNTYYVVINEEVELNYVWRRPTTGMVAHRAWVVKPDGTQKSLEEGSEVVYHTDRSSWVFDEPVKRIMRATEFYTLDQYGDWVFYLETTYTDETTSIDKRIVSVLSQQALAEYNLTTLGLTTSVMGVDFDSEDKLWVLDTDGFKHQLDRHWDRMLVDFNKKILYFHENYDKVRIFGGD